MSKEYDILFNWKQLLTNHKQFLVLLYYQKGISTYKIYVGKLISHVIIVEAILHVIANKI